MDSITVNLQEYLERNPEWCQKIGVTSEVLQQFQKLGRRQLKQLQAVITVPSGSVYRPKALIELGSKTASFYQSLEGAQPAAVSEFFQYIIDSPSLEFGDEAVPMVLDLVKNVLPGASAKARDVVRPRLYDFAQSVLRLFPPELLSYYLESEFIQLVRERADIIADMRWMYYVASPEYDGGVWGRQFIPHLKQNQELVGEQIVVNNSAIMPTVQHWLLEYDAVSGKPGPQRVALDRLNFVHDSPSSQRLTKDDQKILLSLCELYDWFSDPYVTELEVSKFEDIAPDTTRPGMVRQNIAPSDTQQPAAEPLIFPIEPDTLNVQGMLVRTPLNADKQGGLDMVQASPEPSAPIPTIPPAVQRPTQPQSFPQKPVAPPIPSRQPQSVTVPPKPVAPKPVTAQAARPLVVPKPPPAALPHLAPPPIQKRPLSTPIPAVPLDMERIKQEAEKKRAAVQGDIDKRLEDLKSKET